MVGVIVSQVCQSRYHRARAPPHAHDRGDGHHYLPHVASLTLTGLRQVNEVEDSSLQSVSLDSNRFNENNSSYGPLLLMYDSSSYISLRCVVSGQRKKYDPAS